jgi:hypothetical protein
MNHYVGISLYFLIIFIFLGLPTLFFIYMYYYVLTHGKKITKLYAVKKFHLLKFILYFLFPPSSWYVVSKIILLKRYADLKRTTLFFIVITFLLFGCVFTILDTLSVILLKTDNSNFYLLLLTVVIYWGLPLLLLYSYVHSKLRMKNCKH